MAASAAVFVVVVVVSIPFAKVIDWNASHDPPIGKYGSCCAEMDIWEANSRATAYTPLVWWDLFCFFAFVAFFSCPVLRKTASNLIEISWSHMMGLFLFFFFENLHFWTWDVNPLAACIRWQVNRFSSGSPVPYGIVPPHTKSWDLVINTWSLWMAKLDELITKNKSFWDFL